MPEKKYFLVKMVIWLIVVILIPKFFLGEDWMALLGYGVFAAFVGFRVSAAFKKD